jgi:predicted Holliday junction resolvase-like endonuclease
MGSVLEAAKLVTVSWLYNNWEETNRLMKYYFSIAIVLLMAITSMGIFGYLSRAHIESNIVVGANTVQLKTIETQEKIARGKLDYLLARAKDPSTASNKLDKQIQDTQAELTRLTKEKLPLMAEENKLTAEIGPIKYIAEIFYDRNDAGFIDKAVRLVIFTIIVVFDPLAVLLLIASNQTYKRIKAERMDPIEPFKRKAKKNKKVDNTATNTLESFYVDGEMHEMIPKSKITTLDGGIF